MPVRAGRACAPLLVAAALLLGATGAAAETVYKNIPTSLPGNTVSQGFECCQTSEFGGAIHFPDNTARRNAIVKIGLSSWACVTGEAEGNDCQTPPGAKFTLPVTLNVYAAGPGNTVGAKVISKTQTFEIPYRPTASTKCTTGASKGGWYGRNGTGGKACFHGKLFFISFRTGPSLLPESNAIVTLTYNTRDYGYEPTGVSGPADSLNVALTDPEPPFGAPAPGSYANPSEDYAYSFYEFEDPMCGGELGKLGPTGPCDTGYQPLIEVKAT
jgi:hypothetical protein